MTNQDGFSRLDDMLSSRGERMAGQLAERPRRTVLKWFLWILGVVIVLSIIGGVISWAGDWGREAKRVTGPANVSNQYAQVIQDWQSMITSAQNACTAVQSASANPGNPVFVEDPTTAYAATYRNARTDFNRRQQNIFEAKAVGPRGYPRTVDIFPEERKHPIGEGWCTIADNLEAIHE